MQNCKNCGAEMDLMDCEQGGNYKSYSCLNNKCGTTLVREEGHDDVWDKEAIEALYISNVTECFKSVESVKELIADAKKNDYYYEICEHTRSKFGIENLICFDVFTIEEDGEHKEQVFIVEFPMKPDGEVHTAFFRPGQKPFIIMEV